MGYHKEKLQESAQLVPKVENQLNVKFFKLDLLTLMSLMSKAICYELIDYLFEVTGIE